MSDDRDLIQLIANFVEPNESDRLTILRQMRDKVKVKLEEFKLTCLNDDAPTE